jgi:sterol desaturase/sphingolipid hydroxylase (fatty acid hydroxylase superfamily)
MPIPHEVVIRLISFFGIFALMALWEVLAPKRVLSESKTTRWSSNIALTILNSVILRLVFPAAATGTAMYAAAHGWGIFNWLSAPAWLAIVVSFILLDMLIYCQHVMMHAFPLLWRLHRVHHVDLDIDVTTGARFHPIEILFSMLIKFAAIALLGAPVLAVLIFEVVLNVMSMFNHSNIALPALIDQFLRKIVVTPDVHRIHHSVETIETNSNYGFNLVCWDKLFGTYREQPMAGHKGMTIGLLEWRNPNICCHLKGMLSIPFFRK